MHSQKFMKGGAANSPGRSQKNDQIICCWKDLFVLIYLLAKKKRKNRAQGGCDFLKFKTKYLYELTVCIRGDQLGAGGGVVVHWSSS